MAKKLILALALLLLLPIHAGHTEDNGINRAAFTRYNSLWLLENNHEQPIHENAKIGKFSWSADGKWLAYEVTPFDFQEAPTEIWIYNTEANSSTKIKIAGEHPVWNPENLSFAFLSDSILNVVELRNGTPVIHQLTGGVSSFTWDAKGVNLIAAASATLFPDGWSHPRLYEVHWGLEKQNQEMDVKVTPLHTVSSPLKYEELSILAIDVENFSWSKDGKSLAMTVTPTASWSADSNMLSVYVKENKLFIPLGEVLKNPAWVKWAPTKPILASIQGGGRLQGGVKNKALTISTIIPNYKKVHTPNGYADISFDWINDEQLVVARGKETEDSSKQFKASLFVVDIKEKEAVKLPPPPQGSSDMEPNILAGGKRLVWIREDEKGKRHVWSSKVDGKDAQLVLENVLDVVWYKK